MAGSALLAWLLVKLTLVYALRRGLLDQPGRRRSHSLPTPRGGGLGLLLGAMPGLVWAFVGHTSVVWSMPSLLALALACAAVMLSGWRDDHASLPILPRMLVHVLAGVLVSWAIFHGFVFSPSVLALALALVVATAWSINLHNFMDGIDGLLGLQSVFFFTALGALALAAGLAALTTAAWCVAAASGAFLYFNHAPARIFMGDVGSGTLGLLMVILAAMLWQQQPQWLWAIGILCSAFVVDASLTLVSRMLRRRRWYTAHREHLYQWLVRSGFSHSRTGCFYMLWNLLLAAPCAWAAAYWPKAGLPLCVALYALGALLWLYGRRVCVARMAEGAHRAA
ncbi:MAG: glycosyl transferase family 4 [Xanthomonadales bacterium]|nr:glycosyl transferase family 4 [Xanthomonadales bacterium]